MATAPGPSVFPTASSPPAQQQPPASADPAPPATRRAIRPHPVTLDFAAAVPRYWLAGNTIATALINSVSLLFPAGERFFVRSVRYYLAQITPELQASVQGFFGQEGRHAQAHDRVNQLLTEQGYDIAPFLRLFEKLAFGFVEPAAPPALRLAVTAACEHFTAIMADNFLRRQLVTADTNRTMFALLSWHAAEEIEHKAVAFEVLLAVDPRYRTRVAGMVIAAALLAMFWSSGAAVLLVQDAQALGLGRLWADLRQLGRLRRQRQDGGIIASVFVRGIREYLARDFHPDNLDNYALADAHLTAAAPSH
jgi:predicted metal-dependent hydrolase